MNSHTYLLAANAVRDHAAKDIAAAEVLAQTARTAHIVALRAAAVEGVAADSPLYPIACLLSAGLSVGRDDGFPDVHVSPEAARVIKAAVATGLLEKFAKYGSTPDHVRIGGLVICVRYNGGDLCSPCELPEKSGDYKAWRDLTQKREAAAKVLPTL